MDNLLTVVYTQHMDTDTTAPAASLDDLRAQLLGFDRELCTLRAARRRARNVQRKEALRQTYERTFAAWTDLTATIEQAERDEQSASAS